MSGRQPIATAPKDGSKVQVFWKDEDGQENESLAQYRSLDRLKATGGQWDETDAGWWIFTDSNTQKKVTPHAWQPANKAGDDEDEEDDDK
ncbi:hypothetical protein [Phyllobacterium meliloti]|uniref:hypothetical protein n=1 Tax=Phyllobacterium meliloti TaxID=555317 RepID=UPI000DDF88BB|nr:hypothetical protein [Phyllobacterium sp. T1293]UGX86491.1 hypothetical protein LLE53_001030 [Phyllobacterium sp. T1293]